MGRDFFLLLEKVIHFYQRKENILNQEKEKKKKNPNSAIKKEKEKGKLT